MLILLPPSEGKSAPQRGKPLDTAATVYEGKPDDMYIAASREHTPGYERDFVSRSLRS